MFMLQLLHYFDNLVYNCKAFLHALLMKKIMWNNCFYSPLVSILALCPTLTNPANGAVIVSGHSVGDTASYTCIFGFELVGTVTVTCDGGQWSSHPPVCQIIGIKLLASYMPKGFLRFIM